MTGRGCRAAGIRSLLARGALPLFLLLMFAVHGSRLLEAGFILDNTRQYGPPLVADLTGNDLLGDQAQIQYFHAAAPRIYRLIVEALSRGLQLSVVTATKLLALALLVPLAAIAWGLGRTLFREASRSAAFAVLVLANALFSNQMLTGTPRDLGTVFFLALLLALLRRRVLWVLLWLLLLAGAYPTFGILALAMICFAVLLEALDPLRLALVPPRFDRRAAAMLLLTLLTAALGVKLLGPQISKATWGPTFQLFDQRHLGDLVTLSRANASHGLGPSVASLIGFVPSPGAIVSLLHDKRFRFLPSGGEHAFGWIGDPSSILLAAVIVAGCHAAWSARSQRFSPLRERLGADRDRLAWPLAVFLGLLLSSLALYGLAFGLAFLLHNPNRYTMMPSVLLLSGAELYVLSLCAALIERSPIGGSGRTLPARALLPVVLALALPGLRSPVDVLKVPAASLAAVAAHLSPAQAQVLVVGSGSIEELSRLNDALPLMEGVRVFYAEEMDRGFQLRAIRDGQQLRRQDRFLQAMVEERDPQLIPELRRFRVTHLLGRAGVLRSLTPRENCRTPIPGEATASAEPAEPLLLIDLACRDRSASPSP